MIELEPSAPCPCGSGGTYGDCCRRFHRGGGVAATPEQLMRSRYTAYVLHDEEYLSQSWHSSTRPQRIGMTPQLRWLKLDIIDAPAVQGNEGWVEFAARCSLDGRIEEMHERSRFVYEEGRWFYVDGQLHASAKPVKIGRNDPCPCGSGRKYKQCCGK